MDQKDLEFEQDLLDSELLLKNTARSLDDDAQYSLESILAEFGGGSASPAPEKPEKEPAHAPEPPGAAQEKEPGAARHGIVPFPGAKRAAEADETDEEDDAPGEPDEASSPPEDKNETAAEADETADKPLTLQVVLAQTVM